MVEDPKEEEKKDGKENSKLSAVASEQEKTTKMFGPLAEKMKDGLGAQLLGEVDLRDF